MTAVHAHHHAPATASEQPDRRSWTPLALLAVAQFMVILDVTVVNVALPSLGADLGFGGGQLAWVVTAYVLFTGGLMLLGGRLADLLGGRRVFVTGLALFTVASLASGLAWAPAALIVSRAAQGAGAALLLPSALSLIATLYAGHQRAVALAVWGALGSAGAAVGVLLGGAITTLLGWQWIFFVNVPTGALVGLAVRHVIAPDAQRRFSPRRFDLPGAATVMSGLVAVVYGLQGVADHGWTSTRTLGALAAGVAALAAFAAIERRSRHPLVPAAIWRTPSLRPAAAAMLGATGLLVGAFFISTLFLQQTLGMSALETGLAFLPLTLVILVAAHLASHLLPRLGTRIVMVAGFALAAAGAWLLSGAPRDAGYAADLLPGFLALGFGTGLAFVAVSVTAMHDVAHEHAGLTSGIMTTAHEVGAALGVAVLGAVAGGFGDAFLVAAGLAAGLAVLSLLAVPSVRPPAGAAVGMH